MHLQPADYLMASEFGTIEIDTAQGTMLVVVSKLVSIEELPM
ncbi:hypothetical protein ACET9K_14995 [Aeromonas enteropelogenes]|nr:hypothetical protein [Aeromonas enteropelogenes]